VISSVEIIDLVSSDSEAEEDMSLPQPTIQSNNNSIGDDETSSIEILDRCDNDKISSHKQREEKMNNIKSTIIKWLENDVSYELTEELKNYVHKCPVCRYHLKKPTSTLCGHLYCWECISMVIKQSRFPSCPVCLKRISIAQIHRVFL